MNKKYLLLGAVLLLSLAFNRYQHSDLRTEKILTSKKWHSSSEIYLSPTKVEPNELGIDNATKLTIQGNIKYLTNKTYIRETYLKIYRKDTDNVIIIDIADLGEWSSKDGYIFIEPDEYIDISNSERRGIKEEELNVFKQLFEAESRQIRHLDRVNRKTILLTGINNSSRIMFAN